MEFAYDNPLDSTQTGPLVSVILPVDNRARWVARAISSVLSQSYSHLELLVIDDGSTDGTREILESFASQITILDQSHAGAEAARNLGLEHARGEFIAFIDSDDAWYADRLSRQLPLFKNQKVGLVFGNATMVDYRQSPPRQLRRTFFDGVRPSRGYVFEAFARGCFVPCSSVLARRECFADGGRFVRGHAAADYLKWLEISVRYELDYVPDPVFEYAIHAGGISHNLTEALQDRFQAFRDLRERNSNPDIDHVIRRIMFNLSLSMRIDRLRRRSEAGPPSPAFVPPASKNEKLNWSVKFAANQIGTRARWMLKSATGISDWGWR